MNEPSIIHDVLWLFNCSLSEHPVQQMAAKLKAEEGQGQKNSKVYSVISYKLTLWGLCNNNNCVDFVLVVCVVYTEW